MVRAFRTVGTHVEHSLNAVYLLLDRSGYGACHVAASVPGYDAITITVGGVILGNWATGSVVTVIRPASTIITASTVAKMGRFMKNDENISHSVFK